MIDFNTFRALYAEAKNYDSEGKYIMERGWQEWMNGLDDADEIASMLRKIYGMANGGFSEIVSQYKNMKKMCNFFSIPYSTAQIRMIYFVQSYKYAHRRNFFIKTY